MARQMQLDCFCVAETSLVLHPGKSISPRNGEEKGGNPKPGRGRECMTVLIKPGILPENHIVRIAHGQFFVRT
jgi:hypothetical protein